VLLAALDKGKTMRVIRALLFFAVSLFMITGIPSLADFDNELPLHLQPLHAIDTPSIKVTKSKHFFKKSKLKNSCVSTVLIQPHRTIPIKII
jgi:hypothetical protein